MSASQILILDTTAPQFTFGRSHIDSELNLRIPFSVDETPIELDVELQTSLGNFPAVIDDNEFVFAIPLDEVQPLAAIVVQSTDEVRNSETITFGVALWSGAARLEIKIFEFPKINLDTFKDPVPSILSFISPATDIQIFEDPDLEVELSGDIKIDTEMM